MRKLISGTLLASAAATLAVILGASTASALTWTVTGSSADGSITAASQGRTTLTVHDASGDVTLSCSSSSGSGNVPNGTGNGQPLGQITALSFNNCLLAGFIPLTVTAGNFPWNLSGNSFANGVTNGTLSNVHADVSGPSCTMQVDGTAGNAGDGSVGGTYTNGSAVLAVTANSGNLHVWNVNGCSGIVHSGDPASFSGNYNVSPASLTITAA